MDASRYDIISIGDATVDVFLKISDVSIQCSINKRDCLLCLRYADKIGVEEFHRVPAAGNAANNAVGSSRLGFAAALVTILGDDDAGHVLARELRNNRVHTPYVTFDRKHGTNYSTVLNYQNERTILVYHEPRTYTLPKLAPARWVYLTSMRKGWERIVPPLMRYVKQHHARVAFNPGTYQLRSAPSLLNRFLRVVEVLLVNREEAAFLLGVKPALNPAVLLRKLQQRGPNTVVITDGPEGSYARSGAEQWFMPPFPVPAFERTGAGDAYSTGFLAALMRGERVEKAMRWGTLNAGSVIKYIGPQQGLLTVTGMRSFLSRYRRLIPRRYE